MEFYILDTSVVLKWFNTEGEQHTKKALQVLDDLKDQKISIVVPDLIIIELVNVFIKGKQLELKEIQRLITIFFALPLITKEPTESVLALVSDISYKYNLTAYDSLYVATAMEEGCQLISDDAKGHGKITDGTVVMLKDYK